MPTVTFDGQSFSVRGRRIWLSAAEFEYALHQPLAGCSGWRDRLRTLRQAGFNTVMASVPWNLHEARPSRLRFDGHLDLPAFLQCCAEEDLWAVLRIGPVVGGTFDGGGVPAWLADLPAVRLRETNPIAFDRITAWFRALAERLTKHQVGERTPPGAAKAEVAARPSAVGPVMGKPPRGARESAPRAAGAPPLHSTLGSAGLVSPALGPLLAVQLEDDWACGNDREAKSYLREMVRFIREVGISVPILTANRAWATIDAATDVWVGWEHLAATVRQLAHLEPGHPRIAVVRAPDGGQFWGGEESKSLGDSNELGGRLASVLAAGGQFVLGDADTSLHADASSGCQSIPADGIGGRGSTGFFATDARLGVFLDPAGRPLPGTGLIRRVASFASGFGHLLAQATANAAAVVVDPDAVLEGGGDSGVAVVPVQGPGGTATFVFRGGAGATVARGKSRDLAVALLLKDGRRLTGLLGTTPIAWFLTDAELIGAGTLDFANVPPIAFVDRALLVFVGPAGGQATVSLDGAALEIPIPTKAAGATPAVARVKRLTVVVCNEAQAATLILERSSIVVGASTVDAAGQAILAEGFRGACRVSGAGVVTALAKDATRPASAPASAIPVAEWRALPAAEFADGTSERFATLDGPATLAACGGRDGLGWYRLSFRRTAKSPATVLVHAPELADRATFWLDGHRLGSFGVGPDAERLPLELKLTTGVHRLVALVERLGRPVGGEHVGRRPGLGGPLVEVTALKDPPRRDPGVAVNPFAVQPFVYGATEGDHFAADALLWKVPQRKRSPIILDFPPQGSLAGTITVNGTPVARIAADGPAGRGLLCDPERIAALRPGTNEFRFVPDGEVEPQALAALGKAIRLFETVQPLGGDPTWGFARWAPPDRWSEAVAPGNGAKLCPTWLRAEVEVPAARVGELLRLDLAAMGKGRAFLNGQPIGRYWSRDSRGKSVGPQTSLTVPAGTLRAGANEIILFEELGLPPRGIRLIGLSAADR